MQAQAHEIPQIMSVRNWAGIPGGGSFCINPVFFFPMYPLLTIVVDRTVVLVD